MRSAKVMFVLSVAWSLSLKGCCGEPPDVEWERTFGGVGHDSASDVRETEDGRCIVLGTTTSIDSGRPDALLHTLTCHGEGAWCQAFGGTESAPAHSVEETIEGGYVLVGMVYRQGVSTMKGTCFDLTDTERTTS